VIGKDCDIAPSVTMGRNVTIGNKVRVGPHAVLMDNVTIGDNCFIGANCVIGEVSSQFYKDPSQHVAKPTYIGEKSIIRTGAVISEGVEIGNGFQSGPFVTIRENTKIAKGCSIGNHSDIQPDIHIGEMTRIHSSVHLTQGAEIGKYVWIMPACVFTNDNLFPIFTVPQPPVVGDYSVLGARSFFYPNVKLGKHTVVAAGTKVKGTFEDYSFVSGEPARKICDARKFFVEIDGKYHFPYPWPKHIDGQYPWKEIPPEARNLDEFS
jgi:UDP-3-O-[3-hydroxymyristoyl] glucosamine N-acyltransferase